jgi:hypothetical protein
MLGCSGFAWFFCCCGFGGRRKKGGVNREGKKGREKPKGEGL